MTILSIGLTTYNRVDFLRKTLKSILDNNTYDIEVLIGNDYIHSKLSYDLLDNHDKRINIINNKVNLGELDNMNHLLLNAKGRYFTWMFDDDPCSPDMVKQIVAAIERYENPICIFSDYKNLIGVGDYIVKHKEIKSKILTGGDFLDQYFSGKIRTLGCSGVYSTPYLKSIEGAARLTSGKVAIHSEYELILRSGLLNSVVYLDAPLFTTRTHAGSWSTNNYDLYAYVEGGVNLIKIAFEIMSNNKLLFLRKKVLKKIINFVVGSIVVKSGNTEDEVLKTILTNIDLELKKYICQNCAPKDSGDYKNIMMQAKFNMPIFLLKRTIKKRVNLNIYFCLVEIIEFFRKCTKTLKNIL